MAAIEAVFVLFAVVSSALLMWALFRGSALLRRSLYRHRLWRIRDDTWDAIHERRVADERAARRLVSEVERFIAVMDSVGVINSALALIAFKNHRDLFSESPGERSATAALEGSTDPVVQQLLRRRSRAMLGYFVYSSPLGLLAAAALQVRAFFRSGRSRPPQKTVQVVAEREFYAAVSMTTRDHGGVGRELTECVS